MVNLRGIVVGLQADTTVRTRSTHHQNSVSLERGFLFGSTPGAGELVFRLDGSGSPKIIGRYLLLKITSAFYPDDGCIRGGLVWKVTSRQWVVNSTYA